MAGNNDFDTLLSTTLGNYKDSLEDNIFNSMPLLYWLKNKKRKVSLNGGDKIIVPLLYGKNETVKSYSGYEVLDTTPQEGITAAEFSWKQLAGSVTISREEERKNSGEQRVVNLLTSKTMQCQMSIQDALSAMLYGDGTGNNNKDILGLAAIVADDPTTGILGGIDRSDSANAWWRNVSIAGTKTSAAYDNLLSTMRSTYNTSSKGSEHPDLIISDQDTFEGYESLIVDQKRFANEDVADAGFENMKYKGATMMWDPTCPGSSTDGRMYMLNSKYLQWTVDSETDFLTTPFLRPENQDAKTAQVLLMANLVVSNSARHGVIHSIS